MTRRARPSTAIVGAGRLACAIAPALADAGYPVEVIVSRSPSAARRLARSIPGARAASGAGTPLGGASLVLLAIPDREIENVARRLARDNDGWKTRCVLHHAGAYGVAPLQALARRGAAVGVLHPLQSLGPRTPRSVLQGSYARIEGDRRGRSIARR
ncbi:MAG: NAD(P)-binding domain-containing protein, partial [Acidobacteriota bacterium]|nr:NAD(P)-binding domain-containing protein [Acidobacteriota bacterium]